VYGDRGKRLKILFIVIICIGLGSCMRVSDLNENTAFLPPQEIQPSVDLALNQPHFKVGQWPSLNWWETFNSLELNQLVDQALKQNPSIQSVEQKVEVVLQEAKKEKAPLFPFVFFSATEDWGKLSKNGVPFQFNPSLGSIYDLVDLKLSFSYELDFWGKNRNQLEAALGKLQSQRAESKQVALMVTTSMAKAYFALKTNLKRRELYSRLYEIKSDVLSLNDLLYQKALRSKLDPATSVENLEELEKEILALDEEIQSNFYLLNILRGISPDAPLEITSFLQDVPDALELPQNLSSDLLVRRPDLIASIWYIEALAHEVNVAVADFFPRVNLLGFLGLESFPFKHLFDWKSREGRLQPSIHIPIFKAGEIRANFKKNKAELEGAIFNYNELLLASLKEAADSLLLINRTYQQKASQKIILAQAELKFNLLELRYTKGIDGLLTVYEMEAELLQKQLDDVMITYEQYLSVIQMIKALGGGYSTEELDWFTKGGSSE